MLRKFLKSLFKSKVYSRALALVLFGFFLLVFFPAFHTNGLIIFGDLDFGFVSEQYIQRIFPLWNEGWSTTNFFNSTRIFIVGSVHLIASLLGHNPFFFQKIMIFGVLMLSFFGMYVYVHQILSFEKKRKKLCLPHYLIFIIALLVGCFYALNPWSIMRIQHFYLLVGYALLPFILYEVLHFSENKKYYNGKLSPVWRIMIASFLYIIAIGAVHYLFFIFFFIASRFIFRSLLFFYHKQGERFLRFFGFFLLFGIMVASILMYWFIPFMGASGVSNVNPPNLNTVELIGLFSRNSDWTNILYLTSYWWSMVDVGTFSILYWIGGAIIIGSVFLLNLFYLKNRFVLFFFGWAILLVLLSSGTYSFLASTYEWIIFENSFASKFGFIFRDPNKFVGLLALCYGILWATGIAVFSSYLYGIRMTIIREQKVLSKVKNKSVQEVTARYFFLKNLVFIFLGFFITLSIVSYGFYIQPFKETFINNFYSSVEEPEEYKFLREYQKNDPEDNKYFFLPRYESHNSPGISFGVTKWNMPKPGQAHKPTGYIDISSSIKKTYHPAEGAIVYVPLFYNYIEDYLERGIGDNLAKYLQLIGISKLVYHNDMFGLEDFSERQIASIERQPGIEKDKSFGFMSIYNVINPVNYTSLFARNTFHFGGMRTLEVLLSFDGFNHTKFANIFVEQDSNINNWHQYEKSTDIVNVKDKQDLFMSFFNDSYFLKPFQFNTNHDPFFRWSAVRLDVPDWKWHLNHIGIQNWPWDFDLNKGLIFTYPGSTVDLEQYEDFYANGEDILNFKDVVDISEFFTQTKILDTDEKLINISLDKTNKYDDLPSVKGTILKGESDNWIIGRMKTLDAKGDTPYFFDLTMSGKGVHMVHGKVKFLDKNKKEVGIDYVSSPQYLENFDLMKFRGRFITPPETKYLSLYIMSQQKPETNTYWWIHDFKFQSLEKFKKNNVQHTKYNFTNTGLHKVYARFFANSKGGQMQIQVGDTKLNINTKTKQVNKFVWKEIGEVSIDKHGVQDVLIDNVYGFNGLNIVAFIPENEITLLEKRYKANTLIKAKQVSTFEAEEDFEVDGNIQSHTIHTSLSNGKSVNLLDGNVSTQFNILKKGNYNIVLKLNNFTSNTSTLNINVLFEGKTLRQKNFSNPKDDIIFELDSLEIGKYEVVATLQDTSRGIIETSDLQREKIIRSTKRIELDDIIYDDNETGCSFYWGLGSGDVSYFKSKDSVTINVKRGTSCGWISTTHNSYIPVGNTKEYILEYNVTKETTKKFHSRIQFYDKDKQFIAYEFVADHSVTPDNVEEFIEKIIKVPDGSVYMQLRFLQKQRQEFKTQSTVKISNFIMKDYNALPGIDSMVVYDVDSNIFGNTNEVENISYKRKGSMDTIINIGEKSLYPKLQISPLLGKGMLLLNKMNIPNQKLVISGDIDDIFYNTNLLDIVDYDINEYTLTVKNKQGKVSTIFFVGLFEDSLHFMNTFELANNTKSFYSNNSLGGKTLQIAESFSQLWQLNTKEHSNIKPVIVNFFLNGYILPDEKTGEMEINFVIKRYAYMGYLLAIILFVCILFLAHSYFLKANRKAKQTKK